MNDVLVVLPAIGAWVVPFTCLYVAVILTRRHLHERDRRNPLTKNLLRAPGHSLRDKQEDQLGVVTAYIAVGPVVPLLAYAMYQAQIAAGSRPAAAWLYIVVAVAFLIFSGARIARAMKELRSIRLGLEAETAVGQELNWLMRDGFVVFHDVPGDGPFNIDHVLVARCGVFAVETKGRSKPLRDDGQGHKVTFIDGRLQFPDHAEVKPLEQARRNAVWLHKWLSSAVGEQVQCKPALVLPGWYVERKSAPDVVLLSGAEARPYFARLKADVLSEDMIKRITHQLDSRCRDVEPTTYKPVKQ